MPKAKSRVKAKSKDSPYKTYVPIRIDKDLLDTIKLIAKIRGMKYPELIKQVLSSYIKTEKQYGDGRVRDQL